MHLAPSSLDLRLVKGEPLQPHWKEPSQVLLTSCATRLQGVEA